MFDELDKLAMADDSDDYDEYEEEVIERDEEYDDEDDEEEYDEEYDDEEYDDEDYEDEEPEEEYDDGYDDQYYDDRLNQVLDELADLKRNMTAPPAVQQPMQQPVYPSIQPHLLFSVPQNNGNEVVMYNEISRLRDELSKTQNSQSMHVEMSRLKEELERENRQNESQFLAEIKRLNERIEELQDADKTRNAPALSEANRTAGLLPEGQPQNAVTSKELGKLVGINETVLRATRDNDARILADIAEVKTRLESVAANEDVKKALSELQTAVQAVLEAQPAEKQAMEELNAAVSELKERPQCVDHSEALENLNAAVTALKAAVNENAANASNNTAAIDPKLLKKLAHAKAENATVDLTEVIRSVYELKGMLGSNDPNQQALVNMALKAYTDLDLLHVTIANSHDFRMKLEALENFVTSVNMQDFITSDALSAYEIVLKNLLDTPLERAVFDSLCSFATATGKITVSGAKKEAVNKYISFAERAKREEVDQVIEYLPDMITAINDAQGAKNVTAVADQYDDILKLQSERNAMEGEAEKREAETELKALIAELADLRVGDVISYAPVMPLPTSDALHFTEGDSVSDRINALMQAITDLSISVAELASATPVEAADGVAATATVTADGPAAVNGVNDTIEELKAMLVTLDAKVNLDALSADVQRNIAGVTARLSSIENRLASGVAADSEEGTPAYEDVPAPIADNIVATVQNASADISDNVAAQANEILSKLGEQIAGLANADTQAAALEDLAAVKEKLAEQEMFITQIGDLRADLLSLPESMQSTAQFDKLYEDIVSQFDKLYDDIAAIDGEAAEKINVQLADIKTAIDGIASSDLSSAVLDGIIDFRAAYEESASNSAADRQKLLDDMAFVREQAEKYAQTLGEEGLRNEDISAQLSGLQADIADSVQALENRLAAMEQSGAADADSRAQSAQDLSDKLDTIGAALEEIKQKSEALENILNTNGLLAADSQTAVTDDLSRILEQLTPPADSEQAANVYDEIVSISGRLDEIRAAHEEANQATAAALAEIKEQVHMKELEQSIASAASSEEEQKALLTEIGGLRERLNTLESEQKEQADATATQLGLIIDQISALGESLAAEDNKALRASVESIDARLSEYATGNDITSANVMQLLTDVTDIKALLADDGAHDLPEQTVADIQAVLADVTEIKTQLENSAGNSVAEAVAADVKAVIADVSEIKEKLFRGASDDNALNMQILMADVADMKERLNLGMESSSDIVKMQDDITFIRNQIEANIESVPEEDPITASLESEGMSLIMDDIATIKEKLTSMDEYDTVAEILSLREDVKNTRLMDNNDLAAELEALKGDLTELKADISDIKTLRDDADATIIGGTPTSDEVNMLLNEIVSLRDEIQAYKDDVTDIVTTAKSEQTIEPVTAVADENIAVILDELNGLHNELDGLKEESFAEQAGEINEIKSALSELKDMISRRTTLADDGAARDSAVSNELNVVLDEIVNVKDEVAALKNDFTVATESAADARESDAQAEKAALADELQKFKSELYAMVSEKFEELSVIDPAVSEELQSVKDQLADLQLMAVSNVATGGDTEAGNALLGELHDIKEMLRTAPAQPNAVSVDELYSEVLALRQDLSMRQAETQPAAQSDELADIRAELAAIREQLAAPTVLESETDETLLGEVLGLREELAQLRAQMDAVAAPEASEPQTDETVLNEILALREELAALRAGTESEETAELLQTVGVIREDVRAIKEEPDLSIINEVLALRDEFQAFKDELNKTRTAPQEDKTKEELVAQVQSLRDQLFAISMANVNDGTNSDVVYESYNNIILDEITALRDEVAVLKQAEDTKALSEELSQLKDKLTNMAIDDSEKTEAQLEQIRGEIAAWKQSKNEADDNAVLREIEALKEEIANRRAADATTVNFMSEMAQLLERQNAYIGQTSGERFSEEMENLKAELAAALSVPVGGEEIRNELEELRAQLGRNAGGAVTVDNRAVLEELAALRADMRKQNAADGNKQILREISKLKEEIGAIAEREPEDGGALSRSINDLKAELNQLAGFVDDETVAPAPQAAPKKSPSRAKSGGKGTGNRRKSAPKAAPKNEENGLSGDSLLSKIDATSIAIANEADDENGFALNPDFAAEQQPIPATSEEMDIAARIAKQVANKLIMEQLVQQLGDGNVPHSEVEEIVKDILPQEFTTIQVDEQSDKVRRLANSLVLDKLRARLKK